MLHFNSEHVHHNLTNYNSVNFLVVMPCSLLLYFHLLSSHFRSISHSFTTHLSILTTHLHTNIHIDSHKKTYLIHSILFHLTHHLASQFFIYAYSSVTFINCYLPLYSKKYGTQRTSNQKKIPRYLGIAGL